MLIGPAYLVFVRVKIARTCHRDANRSQAVQNVADPNASRGLPT
jgi:hypothetical protein